MSQRLGRSVAIWYKGRLTLRSIPSLCPERAGMSEASGPSTSGSLLPFESGADGALDVFARFEAMLVRNNAGGDFGEAHAQYRCCQCGGGEE